ncbi:hypothetical protein MKW98_030586 [Papaver atlanticum]|uniref:Bifunctional inhibitor/plant lipid transfer protein/seed storage helical domain-containing protein n=1 Tax=Papaver atlanticum TaxID=357466 RepID=A0AAD4SJN8_9MAGN|nr:hypothetical protein MKW98_030586 [Papaver atlanticum]
MCAAAESTTIVSSQEGCSNELTELAVCLPYISSPPNNLTDEVPTSCCDRYKSAYGTGYVTCLCHLVREPCLLGFPVDITRMFALSTVCPSAIPVDGISLEVLCEGTNFYFLLISYSNFAYQEVVSILSNYVFLN